MFELSAEIIYNRKIKKGYFEIALSAPAIAKTALPGQFVNIKVTDGLEPLLRRPLSIHKTKEKKQIVMLYEVLGKGTQKLSRKKAGEYLDVIGPLGNGFRFTPACSPLGEAEGRQGRNHDSRITILVAGGMGTAPLVFLAEKLAKDKTLVLIGAKTKDSILCEKEFKELGCEVKIATDDGSRGFKGYVSGLLIKGLSALSPQPSAIYACGPKLMLKEVGRISVERNIPAQLSLESHMACGIGACMGCVIKVKSKKAPPQRLAGPPISMAEKGKTEFDYKRVCKEGPVFNAQEIIWGV